VDVDVLYLVMAFWSALALGFNTRLSAMMAQALAPTGRADDVHRPVDGLALGRPTGARTGHGMHG
jgi:hypothetical protein